MVIGLMSYKVIATGMSDVGLVRENNEDVWAELPEHQLYVLADGMGGHRAGEVAASNAVSSFCDLMEKIFNHKNKELSLSKIKDAMRQAIEFVNRMLHEMGRNDPQLRGMGTTFCCIHFHSKGIVFANVGDSRIYRLRNYKIEQLTRDHSLFRDLVETGEIDESQASEFQYKNIITRAVGTEASVEPSLYQSDVKEGDILLLCTDGLSDHLLPGEIECILNKLPSTEAQADALVEEAKKKGGNDNITVIVLKVEALPLP